MKSKIISLILLMAILSMQLFFPLIVQAAPSSEIYFEDGSDEEDNILLINKQETVSIVFKNSASGDINDVASTIQNITLAAANLNPNRISIELNAIWEIYYLDGTLRTSGTVNGFMVSDYYSPYSTSEKVDIYTWKIEESEVYTDSNQFYEDLKVLRPQEYVKLTITIKCNGLVGDSRIWFFFRATEYSTSTPIKDLSSIPEDQRMNLYYSKAPGPDKTMYWWPLHNSYDPYDEDIGTGHSFNQHSWTRVPTIRAFSKANKMVHQKPDENPPQEQFSFHICGEKFNDINRNGVRDEGEPGIDGIEIILLGEDMMTPAEEYYKDMFDYTDPDTNPLYSGENELQGSYCFNLENVDPYGKYGDGTYIFYIKEILPEGMIATTPTIIGPITLVANEDGPRESLQNDFGNALPSQIGGTLIASNININPITSFTIVALIASITIVMIIFKRRIIS